MTHFPQNIDEATTLLALAFASVTLVVTVILIFRPRSQVAGIKLLGSLMIMAVAFSANHWGVYALSTFIVATLVTELDFLEKLAAIFWKQDKYWEYRLQNAAGTEVEAKRIEEVEAEEASEEEDDPGQKNRRKEKTPDVLKAAEGFETSVLSALRAKHEPFNRGRLQLHVKISTAFDSLLLDATFRTSGTYYIIEIKNLRHRSSLVNAFHQIQAGVQAYRNYILERGDHHDVIPVLVVPDTLLNSPDLYRDVLPILKFDQNTGRFTNVGQFKLAIERVQQRL